MEKICLLPWLLSTALLGAMSPASGATLTVTSTDDAGPGSLRQAIADANSGDRIEFAVSGSIALTNGELVVETDLSIRGPGAEVLALTASGSRALHVKAGQVEVSDLAFRDCVPGLLSGIGGAAFANRGTMTLQRCLITNNWVFSVPGGGFENSGTLIIEECAFEGNVATRLGHGGAGINGGTLIVSNSILRNNEASMSGGAIYNAGRMLIASSLISENQADDAALYNDYAGTLTVVDSSIIANRSVFSGGGVKNNGILHVSSTTISSNRVHAGVGAGIFSDSGTNQLTSCTIAFNSSPTAGGIYLFRPGSTLQNTIVAENSGGDCGGAFTSQGFNLLKDTSNCTITGVQPSDILGVEPHLGALEQFSRTSFGHLPQAGSRALDQGHRSSLSTDQRGIPRPVDNLFLANAPGGDGSDIGAVEVDKVITALGRTGNDTQISFMTVTGATYRIEFSPVPATSWDELPDVITGIGGILSVVHTNGAIGPAQFYRLKCVRLF